MSGPIPVLLTYQPSTQPSPLQIGTANAPARGRVNVSVSADGPVYCDWIVLAVPVGDAETDLMVEAPTGSVSNAKWTVESAHKKGRELGLDNEILYATVRYRCASSVDYLLDYDLSLGLAGTVNNTLGQAGVIVVEHSGTTGDLSMFVKRQSKIVLDKTSPVFYLENFLANAPATPTVPSTEFPAGAPIDFTWESNGSYFQVYAKGAPEPIHAGTETRFSLPGGVDRDTTFMLVASVGDVELSQEAVARGYEPIYRSQALTVTVSDPVLRPSRVEVSGGLTGHGTTTLEGVTVNGGITVHDTATVTGRLTATADTVLGTATVNGTLTAQHAPVAMQRGGLLLASSSHIDVTKVHAITDGFAIARVLPPANPSKSCFAIAALGTAGTWFETLGGTVGSFDAGDLMYGNPSTIGVPIQADSYWFYRGSNDVNNQTNVPIEIYWFPIGGEAGEPTFQVLSDIEAERAPAPPPVRPRSDPAQLGAARSAAATAFLDRLAAVLGTDLPTGSKAELAELLTRV